MTKLLLLVATLLYLTFDSIAAVPPAEKLVPDDTFVLLTAPDWTKAREIFDKSPQGQFWSDPAMKPFRDKFTAKLKEDVLTPLERDLGIRWEDWAGLAQGQITFALTQNGWPAKEDQKMGWLLLVDTREKSGQLRTNLADLKKKWVDSGKQIKTEKIRDVDFTTLILSSNDLAKTLAKALPAPPTGGQEPFEDPDAKKTATKSEIIIGQSDALLMVGNSSKTIEKTLVSLAGGSVPVLSDLPAYQANHTTLFRDAPICGWINAKLLIDALNQKPSAAAEADAQPNTFLPSLSKIATILGLNGLKTAAVSFRNSNEGGLFQFFLGIPEVERRGLFKVLAFEAKEASPPPFVPADAVKFQRWRIDGQKAWAALEAMITEFSPQLGGFIQMTMATIGKDQDTNFDFKKTFLGNLGNDMITYEKAPKGDTPADLKSPSIFLIGSPNAELLALAIKSGTALMPPQLGGGNPVKEREFLGRKIYTLPAHATGGDAAGQRGLNFAASGGYVAMSSDVALLEQYLRSAESQGKSLRESPGVNEAAQPVGGTATGLFGYSNQGEIMRATYEMMKKNPNSATNSNDLAVLGSAFGISMDQNIFSTWFDYSLLPEYEKVAKYFHFSVYAGSANADGLTLKMFSPVPPPLKK